MPALDVAERFFLARNGLWRMAALLGPVLLARFTVRSLTIDDVEPALGRCSGSTCARSATWHPLSA